MATAEASQVRLNHVGSGPAVVARMRAPVARQMQQTTACSSPIDGVGGTTRGPHDQASLLPPPIASTAGLNGWNIGGGRMGEGWKMRPVICSSRKAAWLGENGETR